MPQDADDGSLLNVFVAEAVEGLAQLRAALVLPGGATPAAESVQPQYILAHRLRGAASLYGFPGVAGLAELLESALERVAAYPAAEWPRVASALAGLVGVLQEQIDLIGRARKEDHAACDDWKLRHPEVVPPPPPPAPAEAAMAQPDLPEAYLLPELDAEVFSYFAPEAQEYLETIEQSLLKLDQSPDNPELIQLLFRTAHTLKGSAYTVGFTAIGDLVHHVEDLMGAIREGRLKVTSWLTDLIFRSVDVVRSLMKRDAAQLANLRFDFQSIKARLHDAAEGLDVTEPAPSRPAASPAPSAAAPPAPVPAAQPAGPPAVQAAPAGAKAEKAEAQPEAEAAPKPAAKDQEEGAVIRVSRDRLERLLNLVGELVIGRGRLEQRLETLEKLSKQVTAYKNRMGEAIRSFEEKHAFTLPKTADGGSTGPVAGVPVPVDFGELEFDKYDDFNILARRVTEISSDIGEAMSQLNGSLRKAREDMGALARMTLGIREEIARARMVPIGAPFTRFRRAVREMAKATGKEATLITSGEHTEVDTVVVERLVDPLVHLVRNAVYHGIETPAVRQAAGKPVSGNVYLHAAHRGNAVVIEVEDDGAGINPTRLKAKAVSLGLLRPEVAEAMPDSEAIRLIFLPGFSTAAEVGDQAGRGVGMDVVKRVIESMNGHIDIETEIGVGTKFTLNLPLTLLISTALLVRAGEERYAIPLPNIREVMLVAPSAIHDVSGRPMVQVGDEAIEIRSFAALLGRAATPPDGPAPVIIARTTAGPVGLIVDELLGRQEIVIKTLGSLKPFQQSCYVGATIDPEGRVILVVDVGRLFGVRTDVIEAKAAPQLAGAIAKGAEPAPAQPQEAPRAALPPAGILLIDDSLSVRKFVGRMLENAGYQVETAVDGEDGVRKASAAAYQLIITDLEMPKLNGYEVIQALRARQQTQQVPILVMTTRAGEKHRQMAMSLGASGYITKPVEERALAQEVEQRIGRATGARF